MPRPSHPQTSLVIFCPRWIISISVKFPNLCFVLLTRKLQFSHYGTLKL
jgi:hypothetical protein